MGISHGGEKASVRLCFFFTHTAARDEPEELGGLRAGFPVILQSDLSPGLLVRYNEEFRRKHTC